MSRVLLTTTSPSQNNTSPPIRWTTVSSLNPATKLPRCAPRDRVANILPPSSPAHTAEIFALATTPTALFSGSGASTINIHRTSDASGTFPIAQSLPAHKLGTHHIAAAPLSSNSTGTVAASVGFGGDVKIWRSDPATGDFALDFEITPAEAKRKGGGDVWAIALDGEEKYLACTTHDGRIHVWDLESRELVQTYETGGAGAGSFGLCVDLSANGKLTATGHHNGSVYVFDNSAGHLKYSLSGMCTSYGGPWEMRLGGGSAGNTSANQYNRSRKTGPRSLLFPRQHAPCRRRRRGHHRDLRRPDRRARWHTEHGLRVLGVDHVSRLVGYGRVPIVGLDGREGQGVVHRSEGLRGDAQ